MWGTWSAPGIREDWRPSYLNSLLRNNPGLKQDGSMFTTRQTDTHTVRIDQLAKQEKSYQKANTLTGWYSPPCSQSCLSWQNICQYNVCHSCQGEGIRLPHQTEYGVSFRSIVVAHFPHYMEWSQFIQMAYPSTLHHHHNPDWCFWSIGLWGCVWKSLASVEMAPKMATTRQNGNHSAQSPRNSCP